MYLFNQNFFLFIFFHIINIFFRVKIYHDLKSKFSIKKNHDSIILNEKNKRIINLI